MSAKGHKQILPYFNAMSALPPKADMCGATTDVRYGLKAGIDASRSGGERFGLRQELCHIPSLRLQMFTVHFERYFGCPC
jgi:hypothetical protein